MLTNNDGIGMCDRYPFYGRACRVPLTCKQRDDNESDDEDKSNCTRN
jgi:hypothetical protein